LNIEELKTRIDLLEKRIVKIENRQDRISKAIEKNSFSRNWKKYKQYQKIQMKGSDVMDIEGWVVKNLRNQLKLSQEKLGDLIGKPQYYVSECENGKDNFRTWDFLILKQELEKETNDKKNAKLAIEAICLILKSRAFEECVNTQKVIALRERMLTKI